MNMSFDDILATVLLVTLISGSMGWIFFSDKIVGLFLSKEERQKSFIMSSDRDRLTIFDKRN